MPQSALIFKEAEANVVFRGDYFEITPAFSCVQYVGIEQVYGVYLNQNIDMPASMVMKIARRVPVFFIKSNGQLVARVSFQV